MAKITWLGDEGDPELNEVELRHHKLKKGEAVEINEPDLVEMCKTNRFFKVEGEADPSKVQEAPPPTEPPPKPRSEVHSGGGRSEGGSRHK